MTNVINLAGEPVAQPVSAPGNAANPTVVEALKELLQRAESGEITGITGTGQTERGATLMILAGHVDTSTLGLLDCLRHRIIDDMLDDMLDDIG